VFQMIFFFVGRILVLFCHFPAERREKSLSRQRDEKGAFRNHKIFL
jgi:hypothetical protein